MWIVIIVLAIVVLILGAYAFSIHNEKEVLMHDMESRMKELKDVKSTLELQEYNLNRRDEIIDSQRAELRTKNADLQTALGAISVAERTISELKQKTNHDESVQKMEKLLKDMDEKYRSQNEFLKELESNIRIKSAELEEKNDQIQQLQAYIQTGRDEAAKWSDKCATLKDEIEDLQNQVDALKAYHQTVLRETMREKEDLDSDRGWVFYVGDREPQLRVLIRELIELYPELKKEFATIEWKKIWLPKVQDLCNKEGLDGKCGIYKLTVIGDESICYIGQAVNIKERWYDHIKKMIGVEGKGSEKLYAYGPDELGWRVVEEVDRSKLTERERYWIEFYGAKEFGLNKRM